jgi:Transcription factor zinc-finger
MIESAQTATRCPSCSQQMQTLEVERYDLGKLNIDLCVQCYVIWFDHAESTQLSPGAVIELFKVVNAHSDKQRLPLAGILPCPRCTSHLNLTHDICKSGRLTYYRCPQHGRLTPFFQFLREKQFIRSLSPAELHHLRVQIKQVQCSGCGASVDLEQDTCCPYCGSPIAVLDADAVKKAIETWSQAEDRRRNRSPEAISQAMVRLAAAHPLVVQPEEAPFSGNSFGDIESGVDLVHVGIGALGGIFSLLDRSES